MKKNITNLILIAILAMFAVSCGNKVREVNKEGVESELIKVESPILDEYNMLMPNCKNVLAVDVEGIDIADAIVYIDEEAGDAYMETEGVGLVPYEGGKPVVMIVSFEEEGGTKEFEVAEKLPEPQVRFFNAATSEIQDYKIDNASAVVIEIFADEKFAELFPEDANYEILSFEAVLMRGEEEIKKVVSVEDPGDQIDISLLQEIAKSEDKIIIEISEIQRINFEGVSYVVAVPEKMQRIELTVQ